MKRKRRPFLPLEDMTAAASPPPDMTLALALHALPESLRLPLMLQYAEGMTYQEISRVLAIPESTVRGRIARAKRMLKKELDDSDAPPMNTVSNINERSETHERPGY